jgi:hypothetical protein
MSAAMTDEERKELGLEFYKQFTSEMAQVSLENQKAFDQAILTLNSGAVALLLTFSQAQKTPLNQNGTMLFSAGFLLISLFLTLASFLVVPSIIRAQLARAYRYYLELDNNALGRMSCPEAMVKAMNIGAALTFFLGMLFGVIFVTANLL